MDDDIWAEGFSVHTRISKGKTLKDYWNAPSSPDTELGFTWSDKPHRLLYDLIGEVAHNRASLESQAAMLRECVEAMSVIATAELYDPATGIIDMDVLEVAQDKARTTLSHVKEVLK